MNGERARIGNIINESLIKIPLKEITKDPSDLDDYKELAQRLNNIITIENKSLGNFRIDRLFYDTKSESLILEIKYWIKFIVVEKEHFKIRSNDLLTFPNNGNSYPISNTQYNVIDDVEFNDLNQRKEIVQTLQLKGKSKRIKEIVTKELVPGQFELDMIGSDNLKPETIWIGVGVSLRGTFDKIEIGRNTLKLNETASFSFNLNAFHHSHGDKVSGSFLAEFNYMKIDIESNYQVVTGQIFDAVYHYNYQTYALGYRMNLSPFRRVGLTPFISIYASYSSQSNLRSVSKVDDVDSRNRLIRNSQDISKNKLGYALEIGAMRSIALKDNEVFIGIEPYLRIEKSSVKYEYFQFQWFGNSERRRLGKGNLVSVGVKLNMKLF